MQLWNSYKSITYKNSASAKNTASSINVYSLKIRINHLFKELSIYRGTDLLYTIPSNPGFLEGLRQILPNIGYHHSSYYPETSEYQERQGFIDIPTTPINMLGAQNGKVIQWNELRQGKCTNMHNFYDTY